ncbi:BspA family leucine-rich repeat surface protein [Enterococcus casseliflavus]|uniref:BspA family leucine-rich repeat surface protein n=1 Tax=Enterococcus casseliflavus TaxID=37734 RepID=UPI0018831576|nr:BspA family leucine-rich repeat surface protein [Enterococcus casseliflavus]MBE9908915.1 BspA family leucine-rich repeat surface protein [Enterococcus casseliflavus]
MKKRKGFVFLLLTIQIFRPVPAVSEAYIQSEELEKQILFGENETSLNSDRPIVEKKYEIDELNFKNGSKTIGLPISDEKDKKKPSFETESQEIGQKNMDHDALDERSSDQGVWGTVPWEYQEETNTMVLYGGDAGIVSAAPWKTYTTIERIDIKETVKLPTNSSSLFSGLVNLMEIQGVEKFDTSSVINMSFMFNNLSSIVTLDLDQWKTSSVINMSNMFSSMSNLKSLSIGSWDTSNVTDMSAMFASIGEVELEISNWVTSNVTQMGSMFFGARIRTLDIEKWDVSSVTNMTTMFASMPSLTFLDIQNWRTSNLRNISWMFLNSSTLETIYVSNWDTSLVNNMSGVFQNTSSITSLDLSGWSTQSVGTNLMTNFFGGMSSLKSLTLGKQSTFTNGVSLPSIPPNDEYTGRWILEGSDIDKDPITFSSSAEFMSNYDGGHPGTYIWERVAPEQLVANIDRVSDQSQTITGYATELVDEFTVTYQNTEGNTVTLRKDDSRIIWGDYQESDQQVRHFRIDLMGDERLETETKVTITVSKPSVETTGDRTEEQTVIKGINYRANNLTLDRFKINELSTQEELDALILQESRAQAANVLTEADMTEDFRIVETDLTREVDEDGSYSAVLEVGNKAYQLTIGIDVTSKLEHMRVTIPTKMVFESLYNTAESNRNFESQAYEIRNQSPLAVDTYVNQLAIDDSASIVLLEAGEDPLDYAESESEEEAPTLTYDDISTPLLRLNLKTEETQIQLYEAMKEQHLVRLEERSRVPISLMGDFYGDYPQWIVDTEADQGGYYEDLLVPKYRIVLRFVPRD